jgi:signal transduction histidine kinase
LEPRLSRARPKASKPVISNQRLAFDPSTTFRVLVRRARGSNGEPLTIYVVTNLGSLERSLRTASALLIVIVPTLIVVVAITSWWIVGRALRPVEQIRAEVADIHASELARRIPEPPVDDEIGRLARTMNTMLDRLESAAERRRRFIGDASHELQSPLASARTELEVALAYPDKADWQGVAAGLLDENKRMEQLVRDLLLLASADEGDLGHMGQSIDLDELVRKEVARASSGPALRIDLSCVEPVKICGNAEALARAFRNLLDNACRHARSAVAVAVAVTHDGDNVEIVVDDDGPGIATADRTRVFERFTRLEKARGRADGGAGLGLAIVKEIVAAHMGTVAVTASENAGARFVVRLPAGR